MDSLFKEYGNPTILLDGVISSGQFSNWVDAHEENKAEQPKEKKYTPDQVEARAEWTKGLNIMPELKKLMLENNVTAWDVEAAVGALKGSPYSQTDSIESYDDAFQMKLIKSFPGMYKKIKKAWDTEEVPFEG